MGKRKYFKISWESLCLDCGYHLPPKMYGYGWQKELCYHPKFYDETRHGPQKAKEATCPKIKRFKELEKIENPHITYTPPAILYKVTL